MKNITIKLLTVITILLFFSCGNERKQNNEQPKTEIIEVAEDKVETENELS